MDTNDRFSMTEIPYSILADFGLTQEMIDDFPASIRTQLLSGRATPALPIIVTDENGNKIKAESCITLIRKNDGSVDVNFIPVWRDKELSEYEEEQQRQLLLGNIIIAELQDRGLCYVQYNEDIKQTMTVPVSILAHNIEILSQFAPIDDNDKVKLSNGEIIEKEEFSIGIDLNSKTGCRISGGDTIQWKLEGKPNNNLTKYNFGLYGCWVNDPITNSLAYVAEDNYTDEMKAEYNRTIQQNAARTQMKNTMHR